MPWKSKEKIIRINKEFSVARYKISVEKINAFLYITDNILKNKTEMESILSNDKNHKVPNKNMIHMLKPIKL